MTRRLLCLLTLALAAAVFLAAPAAHAQEPRPDRRAESLASTPGQRVDEIMADYRGDTPGGVVAVMRTGEIVFARGYGLANVEYGIPNTPTTPYHMASVSKQFTAFAIAMLADEGRLSLDDDVRAHIPELADFGETITLRHLLTHTSGLRDQWTLWAMSGGRMDDVIRQEDLLGLILLQRALNFPPGSEFLYSNTGYTLLAEVVERVTGEDFGAWMRANVFEPLGMRSTQIYDDHQRIVPGRAYSYREGDDGLAKAVLSYANAGATSLFTTAHDLARWLRNFRTGEVGGAGVMARLQERGVLTTGDTLGYALGIGVGDYRGLRRIQHGGADAGYRTLLAYYPDIDAGVIVLANTASFNTGEVATEVAEAFFGGEMAAAEPQSADMADTADATGVPVAREVLERWTPDATELAAYAGRYYSPELETAYTIAMVDGALVARHRRHGDIPLTPTERDTFRARRWFLDQVTFERDRAGAVTGMRGSAGRVRDLRFERQE
ncbi:MAG TPA: serine hydrolase [Longimicrobiales bacterium]|nr:serine hydrolase [Longimicrobiales bacterium]